MEKVEILKSKPLLLDELRKIVAYEEKEQAKLDRNTFGNGYKPSWQLLDVPTEYHPVQKLTLAGFVTKVGRKAYQLIDRAECKKLIEQIDTERKDQAVHIEKVLSESDINELFKGIVGYDDLKALFAQSLASIKPVHIFLVGPPGTAKSLFLMGLEKLGGTTITAGTATKAGIRDVLTDTPRILIIDELDKISSGKDVSALLTWMEQGKVYVTQHGFTDSFQGKGWVFAAANSVKGLPKELLDRFIVVHLQPYAPTQFVEVVKHYLVSTGVEPELAAYIATSVQRYSNSVREAVRVARLCENKKQVDSTIQIIRKYQQKTIY
jgi:Holliday junction DNA helicase RuvB